MAISFAATCYTDHCIVKGDMNNVPILKGHSFEKLLEVFVDEDEKLLKVFDGEDDTKYDFH